jgi:hypothetical protein
MIKDMRCARPEFLQPRLPVHLTYERKPFFGTYDADL